MNSELVIQTPGRGLYEFTDQVQQLVESGGARDGLCTLFVRHTSASLTIQENADPSARRDLESYLLRLVPDGHSSFTHTMEGPDDMASHIKAALTSTSLGIPIADGRLVLGTWQGIFLWEHRVAGSRRRVAVHISP